MINIAGIRFDFVPESSLCPYTFAAAYQPFLRAADRSSPPDALFTILFPDQPRLDTLNTAPFWSNEIWRMGRNDRKSGLIVEIYDVIRARWVPVADIAEDFSTGTIQPFHGRRADPAPHALNYPYDQAILINRLLFKQVMVVHGAGVVVDGNGYVFFGPSGIGKTTISRLWVKRGGTLLNDDRVAIYRDKTGWRIAGTPWHGEEPIVSPLDAPLKGVVRLRQSPENRVRRLSDIEGISELLACALIPFFSRNGIERAMDMMTELPASVPVVELGFRPDPQALDHFLDALDA